MTVQQIDVMNKNIPYIIENYYGLENSEMTL